MIFVVKDIQTLFDPKEDHFCLTFILFDLKAVLSEQHIIWIICCNKSRLLFIIILEINIFFANKLMSFQSKENILFDIFFVILGMYSTLKLMA